MYIGNVKINGFVALAPMAGAADRTFRELCMEHGACYTITELISAKGISRDDKGSRELMKLNDGEHPCAIQLFGDEPEIVAAAAKKASEYKPEVIDINMGCPAPKVSGHGSGCAIMKNPLLAYRIVKAVKEAVELPVTVKIRAGWDENNKNAPEIARAAETAGASAITVHGRTKVQMYAPPVDLDIIKEVKSSVGIPVIGNGDIKTPFDAKRMFEHTGCDMVMVGRGALGDPWIFERINSYLTCGKEPEDISLEEKLKTMEEHILRMCIDKGEYVGMREARKHAAWYMKGLKNAAEYRREACSLERAEDIKRLVDKILTGNRTAN